MRLSDSLRTAFGAVAAHKLRSALTILGIVIGVGAVIAMVAVGGGAREQVVQQIRSLGANLIMVTPGNVTQGGVRLGLGQSSSLTEDDARAIMADIPSVQVAAPSMRGGVQIVAGGQNWATSLFGVDLGWFEAREWDVVSGRLFEPEEVARGAQVILLGQTTARQLFGDSDPEGETVRVRNVPFRVIGVMDRKGQSTWGSDQDDVVFVPLATARQRVLGQNRANARAVNFIHVKVREGENLSQAEEDLRRILRERHRIQPGQEETFQIRNLAELAATREASARTLAWLLAAVALVSLLVGGIGIMNIMLVSVTERTREIGLRLALGARPRDVRRQFLIEATVLSAIGGLIGVALGMGAASWIAQAAGWPLLVDVGTVAMAVIFSGLVGIFFGFYPAQRAARLDPVEALRSV